MNLEPFFERCPLCGSGETSTVAEFPELRFGKCAGCGVIYKTHEARGLRASITRAYDADYFHKGKAKYLERWNHRVAKCRRQLRACLEFVPRANRALDVGCSAGYVLAAAQSLGLEPVGVDYAAFASQMAHERGFASATASLTALPFQDASFDIVTAKHTLEHVDAPKTALAEVKRVLKPGGVTMIVVPDATYWKATARAQTGRYFVPTQLGWQHHVYYSVETLGRALRDAGFEVVAETKAVPRSSAGVFEPIRHAGMKVGLGVWSALHLRHEIQLIARKPS